jgi:hypothetical protein
MEDVLGKVLILAGGGVVAWLLWRAGRPARVFDVRLTGGTPAATAGAVTAAFLNRVREVAADHGIAAGRVWGVADRTGRVRLMFSSHFPEPARQQLRNWWAASGWSAGPRRRG